MLNLHVRGFKSLRRKHGDSSVGRANALEEVLGRRFESFSPFDGPIAQMCTVRVPRQLMLIALIGERDGHRFESG